MFAKAFEMVKKMIKFVPDMITKLAKVVYNFFTKKKTVDDEEEISAPEVEIEFVDGPVA